LAEQTEKQEEIIEQFRAEREVPQDFMESLLLTDHCKNIGFIAAILRVDGDHFENLPLAMRANEELALSAIQGGGFSLQAASEELRGNWSVVYAAVKVDGIELEHATGDLKANLDIVLAAVSQDGLALKFASEEWRGNEVMVNAARRSGAGRGSPAIVAAHYEHRLSIAGGAEATTAGDGDDWAAMAFGGGETQSTLEVEDDGFELLFSLREFRRDRELVAEAVEVSGLWSAPAEIQAEVNALMKESCDRGWSKTPEEMVAGAWSGESEALLAAALQSWVNGEVADTTATAAAAAIAAAAAAEIRAHEEETVKTAGRAGILSSLDRYHY
jgi:hypothetical protein